MTPFLIELAFKSSTIVAVAAAVAGLLRRRGSAALRHLVWTLAVAALLVLPVASAWLPSLRIPVRTEVPLATVSTPPTIAGGAEFGVALTAESTQNPPAGSRTSWTTVVAAVYLAGVLLLVARLVVEQWKTRRMLARTADIDPAADAEWAALFTDCVDRLGVRRPVRLARSRDEAMPMACGVRRPVIVVPAIADMWDADRRRAVVLHELAHVARFDCLTQALAESAAALFWPHPGVWWAVRRLRVERELACDDRVLSAGTEARDYATHLLEIAHSLGGWQAPALAVSMARPRQLEGRMMAMLDDTRNRAVPGPSRRLLAVSATLVVCAPLAAATVVSVPAAPAATPRLAQASSPAAGSPLSAGTWQIRLAQDGRSAHLTISVSANSSHGTTIPVDRIEGLAAILTGPGGPARYSLKRDAGTFDFEGVIRSGAGGGTFAFTSNTAFADELVRRGFSRPSPLELGTLAWSDIGLAFLDELNALRYQKPTLQQLVSGAQHGVSRSYLREMSELGYRVGTIDALIRLRDHGVDAGFVRGMQAQGYKALTVDDLVNARNHGIDAEYVSGLRTAGLPNLSLEQLVGARNHGVDPGYTRALRQLGYQLTLDELIDARNHGVDAGYVKELAAVGYEHLPLADLVKLRNHGIDAKAVERMTGGTGARPPVDRLIEMRSRGADASETTVGPRLKEVNLKKAFVRWIHGWLK